MTTRAQSNTVATVLLVAVVFVIAGGLYVVGSDTVDKATRDAPSAALSLDANDSALVITHRAGDELVFDDTVVVLTAPDGSTQRIPLSAAADGDDNSRLTVGERVKLAYTPSVSSYTIRLVDEPSGLTVSAWERTVSIPSFDLSDRGEGVARSSINSGSTSGDVAFSDGGRTVTIEGNQWVQTSKSYTVTPQTTLSVTFESDSVCEIHAVGFADSQNEKRMVRLAGSQSWGTAVTEFGEPEYREGDGRVSYTIPIGSYYEDEGILNGPNDELTAKLTLTNDCDSGSAVSSEYSGIQIRN